MTMNVSRINFIDLVTAERDRQRNDLGWTFEHDDAHSVNDWVTLLTRYLGKMGDAGEVADVDMYRRRMVQMAAILLAQYESIDRLDQRR